MKFGQKLALEAIPEWKAKYINYDTLKRHLKSIPIVHLAVSATTTPTKGTPSSSDTLGATKDHFEPPWTDPKLSLRERLFFEKLEAELLKVEAFYIDQEEAATRAKLLLVHQINTLHNQATKRKKKRTYLGDLYDPALKKSSSSPSQPHIQPTARSSTGGPHSGISLAFENMNENQWTVASIGSLSPPQLPQKDRSAMHLQKAVLEFYRSLLLLQSYQKLNYTGFLKIVKKYDKVTGRQMKPIYMHHIEARQVFSNRIVEALISEIEYIYSVVFAKGNRHEAMARLRLPDYVHKTHHSSAFASGICGGLSFAILFYVVHMAFARPDQVSPLLLVVYAGLFLPFLVLWALAANFSVWERVRVNYTFIFEWNPRDHLTVPQFTQLIASLTLIFLCLCSLSIFGWIDSLIPAHVQPLLVISWMVIMLCLPFRVFYASSRRWLRHVLWRILMPMRYPVRFKDFFVADLLMSLPFVFRVPYVLHQLACLSTPSSQAARTANVAVPSNWATQCLCMLPSFLRIFQCARRYRDSRAVWPHLANLAKYSLTVLSFAFGGIYFVSWPESTLVLILYIAVLSLSTLINLYWDWVMDWGLLRPHSRHRGLRDMRIYPYPWLYYGAMAVNLVLRLAWCLFLWPTLRTIWIYYAVAVAEVLRRAQWNLFRVEHEHLNNCDEFRAWSSLSLPFESDLFFQPATALPEPASATAPLAPVSGLAQPGAPNASMSESESESSPSASPLHTNMEDEDDEDENEFYIKIQKQSGPHLHIDLEVGSYSSADGSPLSERS